MAEKALDKKLTSLASRLSFLSFILLYFESRASANPLCINRITRSLPNHILAVRVKLTVNKRNFPLSLNNKKIQLLSLVNRFHNKVWSSINSRLKFDACKLNIVISELFSNKILKNAIKLYLNVPLKHRSQSQSSPCFLGF